MNGGVPGMVGGDGGLYIRVPMSLKRRGGRKEIVVSEGLPRRRGSAPQIHSALVLAVIRGHRWKELLESGRYPSIDALATRMGANASYVGRHLNLALLAPDIVEAILMGQEPDGLSLEKLYGLPLGWGEQRRVLAWGDAKPRIQEGRGVRYESVLAAKRESEISGGFGEVVVSLKFHQGAPREMKVLERKPQYRLGG